MLIADKMIPLIFFVQPDMGPTRQRYHGRQNQLRLVVFTPGVDIGAQQYGRMAFAVIKKVFSQLFAQFTPERMMDSFVVSNTTLRRYPSPPAIVFSGLDQEHAPCVNNKAFDRRPVNLIEITLEIITLQHGE